MSDRARRPTPAASRARPAGALLARRLVMTGARPRALIGALIGALIVTALAAGRPAAAQPPAFAEVAGHAFGDRITLHQEMTRYLRALAESSDRVAVVDQGRSWEGRELLLAIVTSPGNHARIEEIRAASGRLADPRGLAPAAAAALRADQPAVVWLGGSIHGFELSGAEGVLMLLERLATADDPETLEVLDGCVVLIDPMLNPDGRDAFAHRNHERLGHRPNPRAEDWSNDHGMWDAVRFRTGHYYFDTNRDWFAHTQAETRARVPTLAAWKPQVMVDLHEMGADSEFFFDPPAPPYGPWFPDFARTWFERFGRAFAAAFDRAGFEYMTGERYNYFYPGYTTSYGSYQGAVSMLFEQGSSRGFALERSDGSVRTLAEAAEQQATAAWTTVLTAARGREELLRDFHEAHRQAIADGGSGTRRYLIVPGGGDPGHERELVALLQRNGIEVGRLTGEARLRGLRSRSGAASPGAGERAFPAGTWVVEAAQPRNRLLRALLEPDLPLPADFLEEARARVDRAENPRFYDITAWSLPLLFDLEVYGSTDAAALAVEPAALGGLDRTAGPGEGPAGYAYLVDGADAASMAVLYHLRHRGIRASVLTAPAVVEGRPVPRGTVVVRVGQGGVDAEAVHDAVRELAAEYGVAVRAVGTALADPGSPGVAALGTGEAIAARPVAVALLAEGPVHPYSFGWAWYALDRRFRIPVTVVRAGSVAATPLADFDVLVVPDVVSGPGAAGSLGEAGTDRLKRWVQDGGTLVAIGGAVDWVRAELDLTALRSWYAEAVEGGRGEPEAKKPEPARFTVPGAILRAELDPRAWLTAGLGGDELPVLATSSRILLPPEGPPAGSRRVAARFAGGPDGGPPLLLSGHAWPESLERLPGAVFAYEERVGRGRVIAFAEDLNFRGYW
ncbi:MAG TPA: M14 family metallopeptidase, partial [Thermoanaerobaculia bacterium]|nr:M14 family metallopeptidase [Thermoanaerobaculia bacterium]